MLLSHGADVNARQKEYYPLYYAVRQDAPEVVSVLLDAGAYVNAMVCNQIITLGYNNKSRIT